jgi:hypothetical protein
MPERLIESLTRRGLLDPQRARDAVQRQVLLGGALDTCLLELRLVSEQAILEGMAAAYALPAATLADVTAPAELRATRVFPEQWAKKHVVAPRSLVGSRLTVLSPAPADVSLLERLGELLELTIEPVLAPEYRVHQRLGLLYDEEPPERFRLLLEQAGDGLIAAVDRARNAGAPTKPLTFGEAVTRLKDARTRDDIIKTALAYAHRDLEHVAVFIVHERHLDGLMALGGSHDSIADVSLSLDDESAFRVVLETQAHYLGPLPGDLLHRGLLAQLGREQPRTALIVPLRLRGRTIALLFGENGMRSIPPRLAADLMLFTTHVQSALEALLLRKKAEAHPEPSRTPHAAPAEAPPAEAPPAEAPPTEAPPAEAPPATLAAEAIEQTVEAATEQPAEAALGAVLDETWADAVSEPTRAPVSLRSTTGESAPLPRERGSSQVAEAPREVVAASLAVAAGVATASAVLDDGPDLVIDEAEPELAPTPEPVAPLRDDGWESPSEDVLVGASRELEHAARAGARGDVPGSFELEASERPPTEDEASIDGAEAGGERTTEGELEEAPSDLATSRGELEEAPSDLATSRGELEEAPSDLATSRGELEEAPSDLATSRGELEEAPSDLATSRGDLEEAPSDLATSRGELEEAPRNLATSSGAGSAFDDAGFVPVADGAAAVLARRLAETVEISRPAIAEPSTDAQSSARIDDELVLSPRPRRHSSPGLTDYALIRAKGSEGSADLLPPPEMPLVERRPSSVLARLTRAAGAPATGDLPRTEAEPAGAASGLAAAISSLAATRPIGEAPLRQLPIEDTETFAIMDSGDEPEVASEATTRDEPPTLEVVVPVPSPTEAPPREAGTDADDDWAPVDTVETAWTDAAPEPPPTLEGSMWAPIEELDRAIEVAQPEWSPTLDDADDLLAARTLPTPRRERDGDGSLLTSDAEWIPALAAAEEALHTPMLPPPALPPARGRELVAPDAPLASRPGDPSVTPVLPVRPLTKHSRRASPGVTPVLMLEAVRGDAEAPPGVAPVRPLTEGASERPSPSITPVLTTLEALLNERPIDEPSAVSTATAEREADRSSSLAPPTDAADAGARAPAEESLDLALPIPALEVPSALPAADAFEPTLRIASPSATEAEAEASASRDDAELVSLATASFVDENTDSLASAFLPQTSWGAPHDDAPSHEDWTPIDLVARPRVERADGGGHAISEDLALEARPRSPSVRAGGSAELAEDATHPVLPRSASFRAGGSADLLETSTPVLGARLGGGLELLEARPRASSFRAGGSADLVVGDAVLGTPESGEDPTLRAGTHDAASAPPSARFEHARIAEHEDGMALADALDDIAIDEGTPPSFELVEVDPRGAHAPAGDTKALGRAEPETWEAVEVGGWDEWSAREQSSPRPDPTAALRGSVREDSTQPDLSAEAWIRASSEVVRARSLSLDLSEPAISVEEPDDGEPVPLLYPSTSPRAVVHAEAEDARLGADAFEEIVPLTQTTLRPRPAEDDPTLPPRGAGVGGGAQSATPVLLGSPVAPGPTDLRTHDALRGLGRGASIEEEIEGLLDHLTSTDAAMRRGARDALVAMGPFVLPRIIDRFPGHITIDPFSPATALPPFADCGELLAILERFGHEAHPFVLRRLDAPDAVQRFFATYFYAVVFAPESIPRLVPRLHDEEPRICMLAARTLFAYREVPEFQMVLDHLHGRLDATSVTARRHAAYLIGLFRDVTAVPRLIAVLDRKEKAILDAVEGALAEITKQRLGSSPKKWRAWWSKNQGRSRIGWLVDGLASKEAPLRKSAAEELRALTGLDLGYDDDAPKKQREDARQRWVKWWSEQHAIHRGHPDGPSS